MLFENADAMKISFNAEAQRRRERKEIYFEAVPLNKIRHTGLDPASGKPLKNLDSGSAKKAVRNDETLY